MNLTALVDDIKSNFVGEALSTSEILISLNRVIATLDLEFKGVEVIYNITDDYNDIENYFAIDATINKIQSLFVDNEKYTNVSRQYYLTNGSTEKIFNVVGNKIYIQGIDTEENTVLLLCKKNLNKFDTSEGTSSSYTQLELPDSAYSVLFYGSLFTIIQKPKYKNKELLNEYRYEYRKAVDDFRGVVEQREPNKSIEREYTW